MDAKRKRRILAIIMTFVMMIECLLVPQSGSTAEAASKLKVTCSQKTIAVNCSITIKTNVKATFASSNKKIATVNSKGVVKGKKVGKVKITITSKSNKKQQKTVTITVKNQLVITAPENSSANLYVGDTVKIKTNLSSKYTSSNTDVATVNSSGKVTAKSAGTAKITVTAKSDKKLKKTVTITVQAKPEPTTEQPTTQTTTNSTTESTVTSDSESTAEAPTVEQPTTTESTTAQPATTEKPTTEQPTTEQPSTTKEPSTEDGPHLEVEYPGGIVARNYFYEEDGSFSIDKYCLNIYLVNGDEKTPISPSFVTDSNYSTEIIDNVTYYTCTVTYQNYSCQYKFQVTEDEVDVDINAIEVSTSETYPVGTIPSFEQLTFYIHYKTGNYTITDIPSDKCTILVNDTRTFVRYDYECNYNGSTVIVPFYTWVRQN